MQNEHTTAQQSEPLVCLAKAYSQNEALKLQIWLDSAGIPYWVQHEQAAALYMYTPAVGPIEFWSTPEAAEQFQASFGVQVPIASHCPACDAATVQGRLDCPSCGLFLG